MQHHHEDVTLECYPPAHHTVTGSGLSSGHLQDTDLRNRLRTITMLVIVGQKWVIMCPHVVQAQITITVCTSNI